MSGDLFRKLSALGLNVEQIAGVVDIIDERDAERAAKDEEGREKARERWRRWKNKQGTNVGKRLPTDANVSKPLARVEDNLPTKEISGQEDKLDTSPSARSKRGTRIPDDFEPDTEWAQAQGLSPSEALGEAAQFLDYWRAKSGSGGVKLDWPSTWRVWVRNAIKRARSNVPRQATSPPARRRNYADAAIDMIGRENGTESIFGNSGDVEFLPAGRGQSGPDAPNLSSGIGRRFVSGHH